MRIDFKRTDVVGRRNRRFGTHEQLLRRIFESPGRCRDRRLADRVGEILQAESARSQCNLIDANLYRARANPIGICCCDAIDRRKFILDDIVDEVGQFAFR